MGAATMGLLPAQLLKLYRMVVKFWLQCLPLSKRSSSPCMGDGFPILIKGTFLMMAEIPTQLLMTNHV